MECVQPFQAFLFALYSVISDAQAQNGVKIAIDFCQLSDPFSCGTFGGVCIAKRSGNRCKCPKGRMGHRCQRPCQDVYRSCEKWHQEERCVWTTPISPFFEDNCALSCGRCQSDGRGLAHALPPILEPLAWLIGRWETETFSGLRFPMPMDSGYREIVDISVSEAPMFDRPALNLSVTAVSSDGTDSRIALGFITMKPFKEDTGFVQFNMSQTGLDQVAIAMVSNSGVITIEEGLMKGESIRLNVTHKLAHNGPIFRS
ncbi:Protein F21A3.3, partial [Aphelenchoides avenae]